MNTDTTATATATESLKRFTDLAYGYPGGCGLSANWPGLTFTESGKARLAAIAGWLTGLEHAGQRELAAKLAKDLDDNLKYLAGYGGLDEVNPQDAGDVTVKVNRYKVVLSDDGTFNGFSVCWYRAVPLTKIKAKAAELDNAAWSGVEEDGTEVPYEESHRRWDAALSSARQELLVAKKNALGDGIDLTEYKGYFPEWDKDRNHYSYHVVEYGFSFNGALLYRGPGGGQLFSVTLDSGAGTDRFWSTHT